MADLVTSTSDPALWASLVAKIEGKGWVILGGTHYKVLYDTSNNLQFLPYENKQLYDSRSTKGPSASYNKLDG